MIKGAVKERMLYYPANFKDLDIILRNNLGALAALDKVPKMRFYASSETAHEEALKGRDKTI